MKSKSNIYPWVLIIAQEYEEHNCHGIDGCMNVSSYSNHSFVYLWNNTIQIIDNDKLNYVYEVDLCRSNELDWLDHIASKVWSTPEMIYGLASAARRIGKLRNIKSKAYYYLWSDERARKAVNRCMKHIKKQRDTSNDTFAERYERSMTLDQFPDNSKRNTCVDAADLLNETEDNEE